MAFFQGESILVDLRRFERLIQVKQGEYSKFEPEKSYIVIAYSTSFGPETLVCCPFHANPKVSDGRTFNSFTISAS